VADEATGGEEFDAKALTTLQHGINDHVAVENVHSSMYWS
jgi:hypothetical protein